MQNEPNAMEKNCHTEMMMFGVEPLSFKGVNEALRGACLGVAVLNFLRLRDAA
jgi:hypothetical protein